jgi:hypothetical protein
MKIKKQVNVKKVNFHGNIHRCGEKRAHRLTAELLLAHLTSFSGCKGFFSLLASSAKKDVRYRGI